MQRYPPSEINLDSRGMMEEYKGTTALIARVLCMAVEKEPAHGRTKAVMKLKKQLLPSWSAWLMDL